MTILFARRAHRLLGAALLALCAGASHAQTTISVAGVEVRQFATRSASNIYAATHGGGLWRSTDGSGSSWSRISLGSSNDRYLTSIAANNAYIIVGAEEGLYRSTDGTSFSKVLSESVTWVAVGPGTSSTVLAAIKGLGIVRSTDSGASFTQATNSAFDSLDMTAVEFDPNNASIAYAASKPDGNGAGGGIWRSTDGGSTWTAYSTGLPSKYVTSIAVAGDGTTYIGIIDPSNQGTAYFRTASGTWTSTNLGGAGFNYGGVVALHRDTNNANTIWASGRTLGLQVGSQTSFSYTFAANPEPNYFFTASNAVATLPGTTTVLQGIKGAGVWRSTNGSNPRNWSRVETFTGADRVLSAAGVGNSTTSMLAGLYAGGLWRSTNSGASWSPPTVTASSADFSLGASFTAVAPFISIWEIAASPNNANLAYAAAGGVGMFYANDGASLFRWNGANWQAITSVNNTQYNLVSESNFAAGTQIYGAAINRSDESVAYAGFLGGTFGIERRSGSSWTFLNLGNSTVTPQTRTIITSGASASRLIALPFDDKPILSTDGGNSWVAVSISQTGFERIRFYGASENPANTNQWVGATNKGVYFSSDTGSSWARATMGSVFSQMAVTAVGFKASNGRAFAADYAGNRFCSANGGQTWVSAGSRLNAGVNAIKTVGGNLYYLTDGAGMVREDGTVLIEDVMKKIARFFLACLLCVGLPGAWAGTLGSEKLLSDGNIGSQFPEVAFYNNVIHVAWVGYASGKQGDIFYSRSTDGGVTWSTGSNLSANATASTGNDRPQVTAGPNGVIVAWNSASDSAAIYLRRSTNAGASFNATQTVIGTEADAYYSRLTDLFTDAAGNVHVAYYTNEDTLGASGQIHHRMSCDGAATFGTDATITNKILDGDYDNEQPRLTEAGGRVYIAYRSSAKGNPQGGWAPYTVMLKTGTVSGCALTGISYPARRLGGGMPLSMNSTYRPEIFADAGGTVHLSFWDNTNGANVVYRKRSSTTGLFNAPLSITTFGVDHLEPGGLTSTPAAAAGGFQNPVGLVSDGTNAVLAYQQNAAKTSGATPFEYGPVFVRESSNNGDTWENAIPVAGTSQGSTARVVFAGSNKVVVVWTDIRSDPTPQILARTYTLGPATTPQLSITPTDFGTVTLGATASRVIQVVNTGPAGAIAASIGGANSADFTIMNNGCGTTIGANASCNMTLSFGPTTIGARAASLVFTTSEGTATGSLTGTATQATSGTGAGRALNTSAVVRGFYETILGRSPDSGGVDFWVNESNRVTGLGADVKEVFFALSVQFFSTTEYLSRNTSDTQYITDLYKTFFLRDADAAGSAFWQSQLNQGMDRGALLTNFLFSTEFSNKMTGLFGTSSTRPEVNMTIDLYRGILGALPDSGGFNFWLGQIRAAQCQGGNAVSNAVSTIAEGFVNSPEYGNREAARPASERNKRHVGDLYNAFLRRGADIGGYGFWAGQLDSGAQTRAQVRASFINSTEFQGRVQQVIAAGCAQ